MKDFEIRCDESHLETNNILYGKFTLGPFLPGQGTTFGNALRRSLLAELSGLSITAFEVIGVMQEFSTLPGLRESVLDLSLNLKQIILTGILPRSTPPIGFLKIRGPAIIKASDLKLPAGIYCVSPEQYIGTLTSNGILNIKFLVSVGKGHSIQPNSLYRSLSKAKLQPTLSSNFVNNTNELLNWGLGPDQSTASSFEQRNVEDSQTKSLFDNFNKIEQKSNFGVSDEVDGATSLRKLARLDTERQLNNLPNPNSSSMSGEPNNQSQSKEDLGSKNSNSSYNYGAESFSGIYSKAIETKLNSLEYANIQKQIFQRINPHQVLPIDAVFTPISQVNFLIQVNDRFETARENLVLEIWTNGSIHPKRALEEGTLSLVHSFDALLKKIKNVSSFSKGLRYWNYLQSSYSYDNSPTQPESNSRSQISIGLNTDSGLPLQDRGLTKQYTLNKRKSNSKNDETSNLMLKDRMPLYKAIYNLDIGNLDLSLQTFVLLKKAQISKLSHLLTKFNLSSKEHNLNEKTISELKGVVNQFGLNY